MCVKFGADLEVCAFIYLYKFNYGYLSPYLALISMLLMPL